MSRRCPCQAGSSTRERLTSPPKARGKLNTASTMFGFSPHLPVMEIDHPFAPLCVRKIGCCVPSLLFSVGSDMPTSSSQHPLFTIFSFYPSKGCKSILLQRCSCVSFSASALRCCLKIQIIVIGALATNRHSSRRSHLQTYPPDSHRHLILQASSLHGRTATLS